MCWWWSWLVTCDQSRWTCTLYPLACGTLCNQEASKHKQSSSRLLLHVPLCSAVSRAALRSSGHCESPVYNLFAVDPKEDPAGELDRAFGYSSCRTKSSIGSSSQVVRLVILHCLLLVPSKTLRPHQLVSWSSCLEVPNIVPKFTFCVAFRHDVSKNVVEP